MAAHYSYSTAKTAQPAHDLKPTTRHTCSASFVDSERDCRQYAADEDASLAEALQHAASRAEDEAAEWLQKAALQLPDVKTTMLWYNASDEQGPPGAAVLQAHVSSCAGRKFGDRLRCIWVYLAGAPIAMDRGLSDPQQSCTQVLLAAAEVVFLATKRMATSARLTSVWCIPF